MKTLITALTFILVACALGGCAAGDKYTPGRMSSGRWVLRLDKPAERWEDAFVTGNGRHGTMVMGQQVNERIICVHE